MLEEDYIKQDDENNEELAQAENSLDEIEELPVDQVEDFTLESTTVFQSLMRRLPLVLGATLLYFIIRSFDPNYIFNPVNSNLFELMAIGILIYGVFSILVLKGIDKTTMYLKTTYQKYKKVNDILDFLSIVPLLMLLITVLNIFFISFSPISGTSMEPNFHDDQAVVFSHINDEYKRFDVVIIFVAELSDPYLIKRVIGLPGETVVIDDNDIFINGVLLVQDFIDQDVVKTYCVSGHDINYCSFTVPLDSYFVLGDNRDGKAIQDAISGYSIDSRTFGSVPKEDIFGKVILTFKDFNLLN